MNQTVQQELQSLKSKLLPLQGAWQGDASIRFVQLMQAWDTDAKRLNDALADIGAAIKGTGVVYDQTEAQQAATLKGIPEGSSIAAALKV